MQYIEYKYAKDNNIVGQVLYEWINITPDLSIYTRGKVIKDWIEEKVLLNTGEKRPEWFSTPKIIEAWERDQADPKYHKKQYTQKYLERNLFKL